MRRARTPVLILLALAVIGAAGYYGFYGLPAAGPNQPGPIATPPATVAVSRGDVRELVSAPGELVETQQTDLTIGVDGQLSEVDARPGDAVKKGQVLARLGDESKYQAAASSAHLALLTAQQALDDLRANAPKVTADAHQALIDAQAAYDQANTAQQALSYPRASKERLDGVYNDYQAALQSVALAQDRYDRVSNLAPDDPRRVDALKALTNAQKQKDQQLGLYNWLSAKPTDQEIADTQAKLDLAKANLDDAMRAWEKVKDGPDPMALELAQAKIADQERQYAQAQDDLAHLTLTAPYDGVITDVKVKPGDQITAQSVLMTLSNPGALEALVTVVEEDYALIQPGQAVQLYFDAQPDAAVTGRVARIVPSRTADASPQDPVYIAIDQLPARLAAGMSVDSSIVIAEKKNVLVLPKALVRARTDGTATVQVWANGHKESREIKIGLIGDQTVEILSGLQEGDQVVGQ